MKKIYYFLMATFVAVCMCAACSSGDEPINDGNSDNGGNGGNDVENGSTTAASIVGTWKCVKCEGYEIYDGEKDEWEDVYGNDEYLEITFNADGTGREIYGEGDYEYTDKFNWTLSGNKLSVKYAGDDEVESVKVESLTSKQLVTVWEWVSSDGMEKEYEKTTFTRVK